MKMEISNMEFHSLEHMTTKIKCIGCADVLPVIRENKDGEKYGDVAVLKKIIRVEPFLLVCAIYCKAFGIANEIVVIIHLENEK